MTNNLYIECGKVVNTHGCHGALKLESWCNTPDDLADLGRIFLNKSGIYKEFKVTKASVFKQFVIITLDDVDSMDDALLLKGATVYAARDDFKLEDGEYFISDLIGVNVIDNDSGKIYGTITDIINRGASDLYVVKTENGDRMIPVVPEFVSSVDVNKGVFVTPIEGMLD